jgi:hypothetical protein
MADRETHQRRTQQPIALAACQADERGRGSTSVAHQIAKICAKYPGCILLFERLRKMRPKGGNKSRRMNRRQANQLRGKITQYTKDKAYASCSTVTVEVNPHGTSQYCSRCGAKGERFSSRGGKRMVAALEVLTQRAREGQNLPRSVGISSAGARLPESLTASRQELAYRRGRLEALARPQEPPVLLLGESQLSSATSH